jgi:hypothetical protein
VLRTFVARLMAGAVLSICLLGPLTLATSAEPFGGARTANGGTTAQTLVDKVHGFHCRRVLGWDSVAGRYHVHSHEGICRNYKRCMRAQKRCVFMLGGGRKDWSYELFGYDTPRYTKCMIRAGCY